MDDDDYQRGYEAGHAYAEKHIAALEKDLMQHSAEIERLRAGLEEVVSIYARAPGWANPDPTTDLVYRMMSAAKEALKQT